MSHTVPSLPTNAPYIPSEMEEKHYLYGLPSKPRLIARSSPSVWMRPTGPEAYLTPKEMTPLGTHRLNEVWEDTVGPAMDDYLLGKQVQCTSLHPLRIGTVSEPSPSPVIMVGVNHGTLSCELGIEVAIHCRSILLQNDISDIHIIVYESRFTRSATMYKPADKYDPTAIIREPFSTTLGIPICNAMTTNIEGTGGFFFTDTNKPGILYLLTARHVVFDPNIEENKLYKFCEGSGQARRKVMLMGEAAFKARCKAIESAISFEEMDIELFRRCLEGDYNWDDADAVRKSTKREMEEAEVAITAFKNLLPNITRDWADEKNRVIGHVTLSPPIGPDYGPGGFTEDWAVIQIYPSVIPRHNFVGNAIDLGSIEFSQFYTWMSPDLNNPTPFEYPIDRLLRFSGTVSDQEMFRPDPKNKDHDNDPAIMVIKNGNTSNLTIGRLNTIRAFVREYSNGQPSQMSREVGVLPRSCSSGPFAECGDSGSVVTDSIGRVCGMLIGGDGTTDDFDCAYFTSINFLVKRLATFGIKANIFPLPVDLPIDP